VATINDIAKMAKVSPSTVSHVVNKTRYVSPELVERVENAIKELEHLPDFILRKKIREAQKVKGKYILLLITNKKSMFQKQVEKLIDEQLKNSGYSLLSLNCAEDITSIKEILAFILNSSMFSGVIYFSDINNIIPKQILKDCKIPAVAIGFEVDGFLVDNIVIDTNEGAYKAVKHLVYKGHELIGFLGNGGQASRKLLGYKKALEDYQINYIDEYVFTDLENEQEIFRVLDVLLSGDESPTALLVANYSGVIPLLKYIESHNIECPDDLSVVCLNNFEWAQLYKPALTTIEQDVEKIVRNAISILFKRINNQEYVNQTAFRNIYKSLHISNKLVVRSSTAAIGRGPFGEKAAQAKSIVLEEDEISLLKPKGVTAAISFHYGGKAWMALLQKGIKEVFEKMGISLIAVTDAHFDPELQCKQLKSLALLEPDIIIAVPTDNKKTSKAFKELVKNNIKLILITNVPDGLTREDYVTCVSTNERSHGQNMGFGLGEYMRRHGLKNFGMVVYDANFYATNQRDNAVMQIMEEEYSDLHLCNELRFSNEDELYKLTSDYIERYPEIEALYVSWDGPATKVISALNDMGRSDIAIITSDLDTPVALNMAKGGMIKMISAQCPYEQGQAIAWAAGNAMLFKEVPSFIGIEPISVTPDNLLKSWTNIFKENPREELISAIRENPNFISQKRGR
jgi:ribose transport system substrate-binding protein